MSNPVTEVLRQIGWIGNKNTTLNRRTKGKPSTNNTPRKATSESRRHKHLTVIKGEEVDTGFRIEEPNFREHLIGIVIPSGCGKTHLAKWFGWIDCDSLIDSSLRHEVEERMYDKLISHTPWNEARQEYVDRVADTLSLMSFTESHPIMLHDHITADMLGIQVCGSINYADLSVVDKLMERDEQHRRAFARINYEVIKTYGPSHGNYVDISSHEEVEMAANYLLGLHGIAVPSPLKYGPECPRTGHTTLRFAGPEVSDLNDLIYAEQCGEVPVSTVNYHIKKRGLCSYKGYGVTLDDWARVFSKARTDPGPVDHSEGDWVALGAMNAKSLGHYFKMGDGPDISYLVQRHRYSDARFVLNTLVHWKSVGVRSRINKTLLKLYGLPRHTWSRVHTGIRKLMVKSETFMGAYVSQEDRQILLDLHNLRFCKGSQLSGLLLDREHEYVASHAGVVSQRKLDKLPGILPDVDNTCAISEGELRYIQNHPNVGCDKLSWEIRSGSGAELTEGLRNCREQIACLLTGTLLNDWRDVPDTHKLPKVCLIIHKIMMDWHRVVIVQDEWAQAVIRLLDCDNLKLANNVVRLLRCTFEEACTGEDWSVRLYKTLQRLVVGMLCAERAGSTLVFNNGEVLMEGVSKTQRLKALADINLPRHMLVSMGDEGLNMVMLINKLRRLERSPTVCILNLLYLEELLPIQTSISTKLASMAYMNDRYSKIVGKDTVRACLSVYYKSWFGERLSDRKLTELSNFIYGKAGKNIPDRNGDVRVFRREFYTQDEGIGCLGVGAKDTSNKLQTLGNVKKFKGVTLLSDANNPQTVLKTKRVYPEGDPTECLARLSRLAHIGSREVKHVCRLPQEVSGERIYGLSSPMVASVIDDISANPRIRERTAGGVWYLLPSCEDDIQQANYSMRVAMDELTDMAI